METSAQNASSTRYPSGKPSSRTAQCDVLSWDAEEVARGLQVKPIVSGPRESFFPLYLEFD